MCEIFLRNCCAWFDKLTMREMVDCSGQVLRFVIACSHHLPHGELVEPRTAVAVDQCRSLPCPINHPFPRHLLVRNQSRPNRISGARWLAQRRCRDHRRRLYRPFRCRASGVGGCRCGVARGLALRRRRIGAQWRPARHRTARLGGRTRGAIWLYPRQGACSILPRKRKATSSNLPRRTRSTSNMCRDKCPSCTRSVI